MKSDKQYNKNMELNTLFSKRLLTASEVAKLICKHPKWLEQKRWEGGGPLFRYIGKTPACEELDVYECTPLKIRER
jgi:hypothetical protein